MGETVRRTDRTDIFKKRGLLAAFLITAAAGGILGCAREAGYPEEERLNSSVTAEQGLPDQDQTPGNPEETKKEQAETETAAQSAQQPSQVWEETDAPVWFNHPAGFYTESIQVELMAPDGEGEIHYTTDGSLPDETSPVYEEPIQLILDRSDFPKACCVQAVVVYEDGSVSRPVGHNYFVGSVLDGRFTTLVFSVSGDPAQLTEEPDGIFYGENYQQRGRESERPVYVEAFTSDGRRILAQYAGARIYGGASRESSVKSMKLFARKSYDPDYGKFHLDVFGTLNTAGDVIDRYDKLVLRNAGNDFQFAYIRDELAQSLARNAGFTDYEAVLPAVGYLNGEYYGFYWLHESYCDDYFKEKYGDAPGAFVIIEGGEQYKSASDDEAEQSSGEEYQSAYWELSGLDLTLEENYLRVTEYIDVENYLDYYAFNIYLSNKDWPNNNYKCYRYEPLEGEKPGTGVYDGRWRYLLHDVDYTFGLYDQRETKANYDTLKQVMDQDTERYAPLFTALMERDDCREYFVEKTLEYMNGALATASILDTFDKLSESRAAELSYYYEYLEGLRNSGDESVWTWSDHLQEYTQQIRDFAASRPAYMACFLQQDLHAEIIQNSEGMYVLDSLSAQE